MVITKLNLQFWSISFWDGPILNRKFDQSNLGIPSFHVPKLQFIYQNEIEHTKIALLLSIWWKLIIDDRSQAQKIGGGSGRPTLYPMMKLDPLWRRWCLRYWLTTAYTYTGLARKGRISQYSGRRHYQSSNPASFHYISWSIYWSYTCTTSGKCTMKNSFILIIYFLLRIYVF